MISSNDEQALRDAFEANKPKEALRTPERLSESLRPVRLVPEPSDEQRRLWDAERAESIRRLILQPKWNIFRGDCGGKGSRLDPKTTTIDSFEIYDEGQAEVVASVRQYIEEIPKHRIEGNGVFLIGAPGTGKDHLAVAIAREFIRHNMTARRFFCPKLKSTLRDSFRGGSSESSLIAPTVSPDVIILSDPVAIGDRLSASQAELFFKIVEARNLQKRPTIVTANFSNEAEAKDVLGSQVVDRLSEGGLRLFCNWESYRTRGRE